ncbi:hypothetical protein EDD15DRAFT_2378396 [Pisolithus albus]|nr:hypothetical protein EDD15DRAFT_2379419 [Pisolithus albus]KAI5982132.1 hypothetical protein EDD15DRAFT_2378396 [Pisolithus albus]
MPHYQMPRASLLRAEMHMTQACFSEFTSLIRSAAKKHLNCELRPEEQDPDDLRRFTSHVHHRQPNFSKKYAESWPVMAYLEIYLFYRIRKATYLKNRFGRHRKVTLLAQANKTGAPFKRNCQASVEAYSKKPTKCQKQCGRSAPDEENEAIKMVYPPKNRVSVVIQNLRKERYVIQISDSESDAESETDVSPSSPFSAPSPRVIAPLRTDAVLDFLSSARPNLSDFHPHLVNLGFIDDDALEAFFSWPVDVQENMMRIELGRLMNPLQLHGLLVAMRARRESTI